MTSKSAIERKLVSNLKLHKELIGHDGCVNCLNWSTTGELLVSGSDDKKLNIYKNPWDMTTTRTRIEPVYVLPTLHEANILKAKFCGPKDSYIMSGAMDGRICLFDSETGHALSHHRLQNDDIRDITPSLSDKNLVYVALSTGSITRIDLRHQLDTQIKLIKTPSYLTPTLNETRPSKAGCLAINPSNPNHVYIGSCDYVLKYDVRKPSFFSQGETGSRLRPTSYPTEIFGCGVSGVGETNLVSSIDFNNNNEMLANYMNGNPLMYKLNVDEDKSRFIQNPESCKYLSAFITENYESLRQNKKAEKLKKKMDGTVDGATFGLTVTKLKTKANEFFKNEHFTKAIEYYSAGIALEPHPILFSNRALSYKKRDLPMDQYKALEDCIEALKLDPMFKKCQFRMTECMFKLNFPIKVVYQNLKDFKKCYPKSDDDDTFVDFWVNVKEKLKDEAYKLTELQEGQLCFNEEFEFIDGLGLSVYNGELVETNATKKFKKNDGESKKSWVNRNGQKPLPIRAYQKFYEGRSHTDTMIKNAKFVGETLIATGSDSGHLFFFDKNSQEIVNIFRADQAIVNIVEPHPIHPLRSIAVSGIDSTIKLYTPFESEIPEENVYKNSMMDYKYEIVEKNENHSRANSSFNPAAMGCTQS